MAESIEWQTGTHTCSCGAKYKATVTKTPMGYVSNGDSGALTNKSQREFIALGPCDDAYTGGFGPESPPLRFAAESQDDGLSFKTRD